MVRIAVTTPCKRCLKPTPSVASEIINWGNLHYKLDLCQKHHMQLEKEIRSWTLLGVLVDDDEPARPQRPVTDEEQQRPPHHYVSRRAERVHVPVIRGETEEEADDLELWRDELPDGAKALAALPELADWRLSRKAREQAGLAGIDVLAVMTTAVMPEVTEDSEDGDPDIRLHVRGSIYALVSLSSKTVITVFRRGQPTRAERSAAYTSH